MKLLARSVVIAWTVLGVGVAVARAEGQVAAATDAAGRDERLRQIAGVLEYIAGDYRGAVSPDGRVLSEGEYTEQKSFVTEADALAQAAGLPAEATLRGIITELGDALEHKRAPSDVATLCKRGKQSIETDYGVSLAPSSVPSRADAMRLYAVQGCPSCHGVDGGANTPAAKQLTPPPANFLDPERVAAVSPYRAFHAISRGVPGTAMVAYPLPEAERWSLAFYVLSLRHTGADLETGRRSFEAAGRPAPDTARGLAALTEEDLIAKLRVLPQEPARRAALAYLRAEAPFATHTAASSSLFGVYRKLDDGLSAYREGNIEKARQLLVSAYLDEFEPHEAQLRARDGKLVGEIEGAMLALRASAADGAKLAAVESQAVHVRALLARAENASGGSNAALLGALAITLREGLEIVLLVAALLALVRKRGHVALAKYVHLGWLAAVPAGLATFFFAGSVLGGMERELAEGIASLVAATVLLGVTHWLLGQLGSKQWVGFLARRMGQVTSSRRAALGVWSLSFLAAYREAFEIVLFFQALVLDAGHAVHQVWLGAAVGLVLLSIVAYGLLRVGQRLKPAPFMLASSLFLAVLALVLVGKGVRALQEAAVLGLSPLQLPELPMAGLFATTQGLLAQGVLISLLTASALWPWLKARRQELADAAPAE